MLFYALVWNIVWGILDLYRILLRFGVDWSSVNYWVALCDVLIPLDRFGPGGSNRGGVGILCPWVPEAFGIASTIWGGPNF